MSNRSEKKLKNQEKIREESHQLEFQESYVQDEKYDEIEE
jgi:hypothetical protein